MNGFGIPKSVDKQLEEQIQFLSDITGLLVKKKELNPESFDLKPRAVIPFDFNLRLGDDYSLHIWKYLVHDDITDEYRDMKYSRGGEF